MTQSYRAVLLIFQFIPPITPGTRYADNWPLLVSKRDVQAGVSVVRTNSQLTKL